MDQVINFGIPHVGELIFESIDTPDLLQCRRVSKTWKALIDNVLFKRWRSNDKMIKAFETGLTEIVKILLERIENMEIKLNATDNIGRTAFMLACIFGRKDIVQILLDNLERNIDLNARNQWGETAFICACNWGRKDVVKLLVQHSKTKGIDISTGTEDLSDEMRLFIDSLQ